MARAPVTFDAFNAVAEPQRRRILTYLTGGERPVGEVARAMRMAQPQASKHLMVLREVGLVRVRRMGKRRLYSLEPEGLLPIQEWLGGFEQFWIESFGRLEAYARELQEGEKADHER